MTTRKAGTVLAGTIRANMSVGVDATTGDPVMTYQHPGSALPGRLLLARTGVVCDANVADRQPILQVFAGLVIGTPIAEMPGANVIAASETSQSYWGDVGEPATYQLGSDWVILSPMPFVYLFPDDTVRIILSNSQAGDVLSNGIAVVQLDAALGLRL